MTDRPGFFFTEPRDERQYVTTGWFMQQTGLPFRTLRDAMDEICLSPDFRLNGIMYFSLHDAWPKLWTHLVNSGLLHAEIHTPAAQVNLKGGDPPG